jgi:DNA mismatch endonuclease, patch repair protein
MTGRTAPTGSEPPVTSWASSEAVRRSMRANRDRDTGPECLLRSALHRRGFRFRVRVRPVLGSNRTADLVFPARLIAVYVDGCFWHGCPKHFVVPKTNADFWERKIAGNKNRDLETVGQATAAGWTVIRLWEHDVAKHLNACVELVARIVAAVPQGPEKPARSDRSPVAVP